MRTLIFILLMSAIALAQVPIPSVYSHLRWDKNRLQLITSTDTLTAQQASARYTLSQMIGKRTGQERGIEIDFAIPEFSGTLYYGFIHYQDSEHPLPVYFKRSAKIKNGKAFIPIKKMHGKYDMIHWEKTGQGTIGYRVVDKQGQILYDGRISFKGTGPFQPVATVISGPFVTCLGPDSAIIHLQLDQPCAATVRVNDRVWQSPAQKEHQITVKGLTPDTFYPYSVEVAGIIQNYSFTTPPAPGTRKPFTFAYASDSRSGNGGGERNVYGSNVYITKKIAATANFFNAAFVQFTGDLVNGYLLNKQELNLQYANWKRAVEPFAHYLPFMVGMGNHEALMYQFKDKQGQRYSIDRFPFENHSAEAIFAANFVLPTNGPESEDGAAYDPYPNRRDFPSYKENVYYYTYDNVAVVVLNSNYWYAPSLKYYPLMGGNLHGYIMDQQLKWLQNTLQLLEQDPNIDHVFVTQHTPLFPNGGHVKDDMWYNGNNRFRAIVAGKPVERGIIERRDQILDLLVNHSSKVVAVLSGDEHNYCRTFIHPTLPRYPENYSYPRVDLKRSIWQINNGAAGAPYYAREKTPWYDYTYSFTTQNAVALFHVQGKKVILEVRNPDTLELIDYLRLK